MFAGLTKQSLVFGMIIPKIIDSPLSCTKEENDVSVEICIYRMEDTDWSLEIVAETGTSTVWDDLFENDADALTEALRAIDEDGIESFSGDEEKQTTIH